MQYRHLLALSCLHLVTATHNPSPNLTIIVSGYDSRITRLSLTSGLGSSLVMERAEYWKVETSMTWLQVEGDIMYAAHEVNSYQGVPGGAISRWKITKKGLMKMEAVNLPTKAPAHLLVSLEHGLAFAANYDGHSFTAVRLDEQDGSLADISYHETFGGWESHPHQTVVWGPWVWVVDLGLDTIWHYQVQDKQVKKLNKTLLDAGSGPRHMVVHSTKQLAFIVCELKNMVEVYRMNVTNGILKRVQQIELSKDQDDYGAEIAEGPGGEHLYASSRGSGVIVVYRIGKDDMLVRIQHFHLSGTWPRHFAIYGYELVVADERGNSVQLVTIDKVTGELESDGALVTTGARPAFVCFVE